MEEHCRLISDRDYKEWKECVQKMHILEKENKQLLKKLDELENQLDEANWIIKLLIKNSTNYYPRIREAKNYFKKHNIDWLKLEELK